MEGIRLFTICHRCGSKFQVNSVNCDSLCPECRDEANDVASRLFYALITRRRAAMVKTVKHGSGSFSTGFAL
jgi:hypothetical protein